MPGEEAIRKSEPRRLLRLTLVLLGIALGQFILYGPSLTGRKILLPLDILAGQGFYLPQTPDFARIRAKDGSVADQVLQFEPARRFAISEFRAGRLPMWAPYEYAGAPFNWPVVSPLCCCDRPRNLAVHNPASTEQAPFECPPGGRD